MNEEQKQDNIQVVNEEEQEQDNIQAVNKEEQEQDNIQAVNKEEQEQDDVQEVNEGYSGVTKKRRWFILQEKLMYLQVICQKVDKGFSLQEASKSINISHKQILKWKKQAATMNNQQVKSLGDGVTSFLSLYTDNLFFFINRILSKNQILVSCSHMTCYLQNLHYISIYIFYLLFISKKFSNIQK